MHWPSTSGDRKQASGRRLVLGEVKYGEGALDGVVGLAAHVRGVNEFLADPARVAALKNEMRTLFNQKRALGLIECDKDLASFGAEPPILLLLLANHDPGSSKLREIVPALPPSPHAELRLAVGGVVGYALYDPAILPLAEAQTCFAAVLQPPYACDLLADFRQRFFFGFQRICKSRPFSGARVWSQRECACW